MPVAIRFPIVSSIGTIENIMCHVNHSRHCLPRPAGLWGASFLREQRAEKRCRMEGYSKEGIKTVIADRGRALRSTFLGSFQLLYLFEEFFCLVDKLIHLFIVGIDQPHQFPFSDSFR